MLYGKKTHIMDTHRQTLRHMTTANWTYVIDQRVFVVCIVGWINLFQPADHILDAARNFDGGFVQCRRTGRLDNVAPFGALSCLRCEPSHSTTYILYNIHTNYIHIFIQTWWRIFSHSVGSDRTRDLWVIIHRQYDRWFNMFWRL